MFSLIFAAASVFAQEPAPFQYPAGCDGPTHPNNAECRIRNWDLGDRVDRCAPIGTPPVVGQQIYIQDPENFCLMMPDPLSPHLQREYYNKNQKPTFVAGEGYVRGFCTGSYKSPGAMEIPKGAILSAHVVKNVHTNGKKYWEVSGKMDCEKMGINCKSSVPGAFDDGGQMDAVEFKKCGKEPYSGVDSVKHPGMVDYVQQTGNGEYCLRICEAGQQLEDPCNVKNDTSGCTATFGIQFKDGFSFVDLTPEGDKKTTFFQTTTTAPTTTAAAAAPTATNTPDSALTSSISLGLLAFLLVI